MSTTSQPHTFPATGVVVENLPGAVFRVKIEQTETPEMIEKLILCTISGKMRMHWVRLLPGDKVSVDISLLDPTKGRITYRLK